MGANPTHLRRTVSEPTAPPEERPGTIQAVPVRHPWRYVAVAVIGVLAAMFVHLLVTNDAWNWPFMFEAMRQTPVLTGLMVGTLFVSVVAMLVAVVLAIGIALMRMSDNPILTGVAFAWSWFFRGIPRYVLLCVMGALGVLFQEGLSLGVPFDWWFIERLGLSGSWRFLTLDANALFSGLFGAILGMALSESAYMAEIVRAGIQSVDPGQQEAAQALGMNKHLSMFRIILPQAMRVIVPPTSSEFISLVKDTSLLTALPLTNEMFFQMRSIGSRTYQVFPVLVGAALYYLAITTILMLLQSLLERRFNRGQSKQASAAQQVAMAGVMQS